MSEAPSMTQLQRGWFAVAISVMPLSFGLKQVMGLSENVPWFNPTLALVPLLALVGLRPAMDRVLWTLTAALTLLMAVSCLDNVFQDEPHSLVRLLREPGRILLSLVWFALVLRVMRSDPRFAVRVLSVNVLVQFCLGMLFFVAAMGVIRLPGPPGEYVANFMELQVFHIAGFNIPRMAGIFAESPPFGLYMLCAHVVLTAWVFKLHLDTGWPRTMKIVWLMSFVGVLGSTAAQCWGALLLFYAIVYSHSVLQRGGLLLILPGAVVLLLAGVFFWNVVAARFENSDLGEDVVIGHSVSERAFHVRRGLQIFMSDPMATAAGIGPGMYGTRIAPGTEFPDTTTVQVTPITWLVELGAVGTGIVILWLIVVARHARRGLSQLGLAGVVAVTTANAFQTTWVWEFWFFALAALYASEGFVSASEPRVTQRRSASRPFALGYNQLQGQLSEV
jgi:hypothetical protein